MALCLSWGRCLSSHLWLFQLPGTEGLWHRSGLMWTTVEQGESSTERARSPPSWRGLQGMSGRTFQSSPTSTQHGSSFLHGTKLLSLEATPSHRYKLTLILQLSPLPADCLNSADSLCNFYVSLGPRSVIPNQGYSCNRDELLGTTGLDNLKSQK